MIELVEQFQVKPAAVAREVLKSSCFQKPWKIPGKEPVPDAF